MFLTAIVFVYDLFLMKLDTLSLITTMFVRPDANLNRGNVWLFLVVIVVVVNLIVIFEMALL